MPGRFLAAGGLVVPGDFVKSSAKVRICIALGYAAVYYVSSVAVAIVALGLDGVGFALTFPFVAPTGVYTISHIPYYWQIALAWAIALAFLYISIFFFRFKTISGRLVSYLSWGVFTAALTFLSLMYMYSD